jgi:hypothetical protein
MEAGYHTSDYKYKGVFFPAGYDVTQNLTDSVEIVFDGEPMMLYRWSFEIQIEQRLSYSLYPFGKKDVSFFLWSNDFDDNTILTPDLDGYGQIYPSDLPGLDNHFRIKGWDVSATYYSYSMESYLCDFGNSDMYGVNNFPELAYNISVSRKFMDILITKIVPLTVVLILLFTILFVREKSDGFNNIIGCSSLFFVLILDHINFRESILPEHIMYLEFCYFFSYALILLITVTSFDTSKGGNSYNSWVDTFLKRYFWSLISCSMAAVTVAYFW